MAIVQCSTCGKEFSVVPARLKTAKFCSYKCRGEWRTKHFTGSNNPNFRGGHEKSCECCGNKFWVIPAREHQKFCSKPCADKMGFRYSGKEHPNYREDARRKNRGGNHHKWVNAVISRDKAICQHCEAHGVELHAHHIKSYKDHPDLRFDVNNGITLCYKCHWALHTVQNEKAVNSVEPLTSLGVTKGNTEPSLNLKVLEGVTTRGRASRRVVKPCDWCGKIVSKRYSDVVKSGLMFCNKVCMGKHLAATRTYRRWKNPTMAVISSTSPAPEREDIV